MNLTMVFDFHIIVSILFVLAAWRFGDWRNWKLYYPTILFFIVGEFLYGLLCYNHPLWSYESQLQKVIFSHILNAIFVYPSTILIFLPHMPTGFRKRVLYILLWVGIYSCIEYTSYRLGFFSYDHGWNFYFSVLFNFCMFPLFWLHHKKPLLACTLLIVAAGAGLLMFQVPIDSIK